MDHWGVGSLEWILLWWTSLLSKEPSETVGDPLSFLEDLYFLNPLPSSILNPPLPPSQNHSQGLVSDLSGIKAV